MIPEDREERELLAAEYVLGTLEAREAAALEEALPGDAGLRQEVEQWRRRLAPLSHLQPALDPPSALWPRIEASLAGLGPASSRAAPRREKAGWMWRGWALGSTALAAGLAAFLWLRPAPERLTTVLLTQRDQPAWLVEAQGGALRLAALNPQPVDPSRVLQLWALPQGATAPTSLGLIPGDGSVTVTPGGLAPSPGMLIEISLEPPGGSPTGRPTGPILFIGRLTAVGGA